MADKVDSRAFLNSILAPQAHAPIPMMDNLVPVADDEFAPSPEDNMPALPAEPKEDDESPEATAAAESQYKLASQQGGINGKVLPPQTATPDDSTDDVTAQIDQMGKDGAGRLDQELSDSDAMQSPLDETRMPASESPIQSQQAKMQDILSSYQQLKNAQAKQQSDLGNIAMLGGANKIAQGFAIGHGGHIGANEEGIKQLQDAADQPVKNIEAQIKYGGDAANDPNSSVSKLAQGMAVKIMSRGETDPVKLAALQDKFSGLSAFDLEKLGFKGASSLNNGRQGFTLVRGLLTHDGHPVNQEPSTGKYYDGLTGQLLAGDEKMINMTPHVDAMTGKLAATAPGLLPTLNQNSNLGESSGATTTLPDGTQAREVTVNDLNRENPKFFEKNFSPIAQEAAADPVVKAAGDINRNAAIMLAKLQPDPKTGLVDSGALPAIRAQYAAMSTGGPATDAAMHEIQGKGGSLAEIDQALQKLEGNITPENIKFFKDALYKFQNAGQQVAQDSAQKYIDRAKALYPQANMSDDNVKKLLGLQSLGQNTMVAQAKAADAAKAGLVTLIGPSGETAQMTKENAKKYLSKPGYKLVQ